MNGALVVIGLTLRIRALATRLCGPNTRLAARRDTRGRRQHRGRHCADADAAAHLAAMTPDEPVPYWPAYLPDPAPDSGRPVQASRPGDPPYVECGAVRAGATPQTPAAVSAPVDGAQEVAATPSGVTAPLPGPTTPPHGAGQPRLSDLVRPLKVPPGGTWVADGVTHFRRHDGIIAVIDQPNGSTRTLIYTADSLRATRAWKAPEVIDGPVVPRWYLARLSERPELLSAADVEWLDARRSEMAGAPS